MKLILKYPLKHPYVTQGFNDNALSVYGAQGMKGHGGVDFVANHGTEVYASHDGVAYYQIDDAGGHGVIIITEEQFEYKDREAYYKSIYWHLINPLSEPEYRSPIQDFPYGKKVKTGELIGYADNTGTSTGNHLHWGLKPVEKVNNYLYKNIEQDNGYFGAIDPILYLELSTPILLKPILFSKDLKFRMMDPDVLRLQQYLNTHGFILAESGVGSLGHETVSFGALTLAAVKRFQEANCLPQTGYFGPLSRAVINNK